MSCCQNLGVPIKQEKVEGSTRVLEFLGIVIDTDHIELRLSQERVTSLKGLLHQWEHNKQCRKLELLSLIGKLVHALTVVRLGTIFVRRLINLSSKVTRLYHWLHLSTEARADMLWWSAFLEAGNHIPMRHQIISQQACGSVVWQSFSSAAYQN